jgi:aspartyl-tRNA synthetase
MSERVLIADIIKHEGETITLKGWVDVRRDHGKIFFIDFRDRSAVAQVVFSPDKPFFEEATKMRAGWVIEISGLIKRRPEKMVNSNMITGTHEVEAVGYSVLNESEPLPIPIDTDGSEIDEEARMKYRYLDLRRPRLQHNLKLRNAFVQKAREYLLNQDFTEIETPYFSSPTPEGSRDFVVPSRMYPGKFFALPQSPQQYKQLLMVAAFERYFQLARCFRDEDLRADRGFEHTQIDIETSFLTREEIMALDEAMITYAVEAVGGKIKEKPFPHFTYKEAMEKYGADKFDLRTEEDKKNGILAFAWVTEFPFFEKADDGSWTFTHNPFSMPAPEHLEWHLKGENVGQIITQQYDLVCNGYEVGGGSVRAHRPDILAATFRTMGYPEEKIRTDFGHMIDAMKFGAPPHGGIAHGVERMVMILTGETYLREVTAFPQTASGRTSVMDAPVEIPSSALKELGLKVENLKKE